MRVRTVAWLVGLLAIAALALRPTPGADTGSVIRVSHEVLGCPKNYSYVEATWRRRPGASEWTSAEPGARLSPAQVEHLREVLLEPPVTRDRVVEELGVTRAAFQRHRKAMLGAVGLTEAPLLTYERLAPEVRDYAVSVGRWSTAAPRVEVRVFGETPIRAVSQGIEPYLLPWRIETEGRSWTTCSPRISRALLPLIGERWGLDGREYWAREFWTDPWAWGGLTHELELLRVVELARELEGYAEFERDFAIEQGLVGCVNRSEESLFVQVRSRVDRPLDGAWWWSPLRDGRPRATMRQFLEVHAACESAVGRNRWLLEWKAAGADRTLELHSVGSRGYEHEQDYALARQAWRAARLAGEPRFEVLLRKGPDSFGTAYLGTGSSALVTSLRGDTNQRKHWLDSERVQFSRWDRRFLLVDGHGRLHRLTAEAASQGR